MIKQVQSMDSHRDALTRLEVGATIVAAMVHDIAHPALNNAFQINSRSDKAVLCKLA
jgi:hypothetical protein